MRLRDYFLGYRVEMTSPYSREEVEQRIRVGTASPFLLFQEGILGWARFGRLRLSVRAGFWHFSGGMFLAGRLKPERSGTSLVLHYRSPRALWVSLPLWYLFLSFFVLLFLSGGEWAPDVDTIEKVGIGLFVASFYAWPAFFTWLAMRGADADFERLIEFLETTAHARVMRDRMGPTSSRMPAPPSIRDERAD